MRTMVLVGASALLGGWAYNSFVKGKLVDESPGMGLDDVAFAATVAGTFYLLHRFVPRFGK